MTLSKRFEKQDDSCAKCGGPLASRQAHPFPVLEQVLFAASFIAFLVLFDKLAGHRLWIWAWSGLQIALGILLIRGRLRARKRVLRCIRCDADLR